MLGSGSNSTRGSTGMSSEMPPLTQCLPLKPITLGNQKYTCSGELRRALGVPFGSTWEDHSFRAAHTKPSTPVAMEELKHIKDSVEDSSNMARDRAKLLHENIFKLDKYEDTLSSKKRQRSDHLSCVKLGGPKLKKMGSQINRSSREMTPQRLEERAKILGLNKRAHTVVGDGEADCRPRPISRQQMVLEKDGDTLHAGGEVSIRIEEKIRRLPTGGDGWNKKVKKKRSVGAVGNRVTIADRDVKGAMHPKMNADSKLRSCDAQSFRLKSSAGVGGIDQLERSFEPSSSNASTVFRSEPESVPLSRYPTTMLEHKVVKGNNNSNIRDDNPVRSTSTLLKAKISRAPRTGSVMALDSSLNVETSSGAQGWGQPTIVSKVRASVEANNPKISISTGSPSHSIAQWVGQRPNKKSRMRRSSLISPVSDHVGTHISPVGVASDFNARTSSVGTNGSLLASRVDNNTPKIKRKFGNVSSSVRLSESEESGDGEERFKGEGTYSGQVAKDVAHKVGTFALHTRKNKVPTSDIGEGVPRQGRSGRGLSLTRPTIPPGREKLDNIPTTRPFQSARPSPDKIKSKPGRPPLKKLKDQKAVTLAGTMLNVGSSDHTGEPDDHEELFAAANSARNVSNLACSGPFWKKMEPIFASVSSEDTSYLKKQLSFAEELDQGLSAVFGIDYNVLGGIVHEEVPICTGVRQGSSDHVLVNNDASSGRFDNRKLDKVTPLYQRVLSALIEEDETEDYYRHSEGKSMSLQYMSDDSHCGSCNHVDGEPKERDRMESEVESRGDDQSQKNCLLDRFSADKSVASDPLMSSGTPSSLHSDEKWQGVDGYSHSDVGLVSQTYDSSGLQPGELNVSGLSSSDSQYQSMCLDDRLLLELQSIGLYPETLPDLAEEDVINQDIMELKEGLYQQVGRKKKNLGKIDKAIQNGRDEEKRNMEQVAMDQLIEMAYRKRLACRGSNASKSTARKVSRQAALAFVKCSLARCRKFEDTGSSCFGEPALQDVIFSAPPCSSGAKSVDCVGSGTASNTYNEASNRQEEARGSGAVSSTLNVYGSHIDIGNVGRGFPDAPLPGQEYFKQQQPVLKKGRKREVPIDDIIGSASSRVTSSRDYNLDSGTKGKRSERDRPSSSTGERKTKAKSQQNNNNITSASGNRPHGRLKAASVAEDPACPPSRELKPPPGPKTISEEPSELENMEVHELDPAGIEGPQDLTSWFDFEDDGLLDHDSMMGLEIPMDDLSDLVLM